MILTEIFIFKLFYLYQFQVYSIVVTQSYTLQSLLPDIFSTQLASYVVIAVLLLLLNIGIGSRERERKGKREKHQLVASHLHPNQVPNLQPRCTMTRNWTHDPLGSQDNIPTNWVTLTGPQYY